MRFSHKLKKLGDPRTLQSARRHLGLIALSRRFVFSLNEQTIIDSIDREKFRAIYDRHAVPEPGEHWPKYLELKRWIAINLGRVHQLDLDWGRRKEILDIGCGAGYFLYICKWLGHRPLGLDIEEVEMYREMTALLGIPRVIWRVHAYELLPDFGRKFDLVTAFMICFHGHKSPALWGPPEWEFFLDDLETRLKPGGRIHLGFNRELDDKFYPDKVRRYFLERGAKIEEDRVTFWPSARKPLEPIPTAALAPNDRMSFA